MRPHLRDLFGSVIVTLADVDLWLATVPCIDPAGPRAAWYVKAYSVTEKITAAKLAGTFEGLTELRDHPAHWWARFRWN